MSRLRIFLISGLVTLAGLAAAVPSASAQASEEHASCAGLISSFAGPLQARPAYTVIPGQIFSEVARKKGNREYCLGLVLIPTGQQSLRRISAQGWEFDPPAARVLVSQKIVSIGRDGIEVVARTANLYALQGGRVTHLKIFQSNPAASRVSQSRAIAEARDSRHALDAGRGAGIHDVHEYGPLASGLALPPLEVSVPT